MSLQQGGVMRVHLSQFRSYRSFQLQMTSGSVVLTGPNGVGKTNLLEALSLLGPGRGFRSARLGEMVAQGQSVPAPWSIFAEIGTVAGEKLAAATRLDPQSLHHGQERRQLYLEGALLAQQAALLDHLWIVSLTPQMDGILREGSQGRRKFLDHMVAGLDPQHHHRLASYAHHMKERNALLKNPRFDPLWMETLEAKMAQSAVAIAAQRLDVLQKLQDLLAQPVHRFPVPMLTLEGDLESLLIDHPGLWVEEHYQKQLVQNRGHDQMTGQCQKGPHRADVRVVYAASGRPAASCSTGEQKALLISWLLAGTELYQKHRTGVPLLLLDEVMAHLDAQRRIDFFEEIDRLKIQSWMTGTDLSFFRPFSKRLQCFDLMTLKHV